MLIFPLFILGQSVEPQDSLVRRIIYNNKHDLQEETRLLQQFKEKNWLSLLPSIGYDLVTNRPLVNFSLTNLISMNQRKRDVEFQVQQLKSRYHNQLIADTIACRFYYRELKELLENYAGQLALLDNSYQLLRIKEEENRRLQVTQEELLRVKLELERLGLSVNETRKNILSKALQISLLVKRLIHYKLP